MKIKTLLKVLGRNDAANLPVTRYHLEPVSKTVDFKGSDANPLNLRGLFIS